MSGILNQTGAVSGILGTTVGTPSSNAADIGAGVLPVGVTGGSGLDAVSPANLASGVMPVGVTSVYTFGISNASQWRITSSFAGTGVLSSNWEEADVPAGFGILGSSITESSGIFTFPTTGYWHITGHGYHQADSVTSAYLGFEIDTTTNNSTYAIASIKYTHMSPYSNAHTQSNCFYIFDVTNTSTHKCRFYTGHQASCNNGANSNVMYTGATFIRLGDT